ncbi:protein of unknown function [Seinonella peptonophila]|uniref:DUF4281 domain-containing protein n=1 Tax=Seinonella peptonophila TaxID=112248 RepID=A0A1M4U383_9BACL|nr:ABA4-like family protein [Seinonella peptonophila]SHE51229.1 protein of unknown function [Seinonella peptonophila]
MLINYLYTLASLAVFFWLLLILLPKWSLTKWISSKLVFPFYLATLYTIGIISVVLDSGFGFVQNFNSADGVIHLLSNPQFALLCWIHILCFDQVIGHYIYQDNMKNRYLPLFIQSILLFITLMLGPLGFLIYGFVKGLRKWKRTDESNDRSRDFDRV